MALCACLTVIPRPRYRTAGMCVCTHECGMCIFVCALRVQGQCPWSAGWSPPLSHSAQLPAICSLGLPWASCCPRCQADPCLSHASCPSGPEGWKQAKERGQEGRKGSDRTLGNTDGLEVDTKNQRLPGDHLLLGFILERLRRGTCPTAELLTCMPHFTSFQKSERIPTVHLALCFSTSPNPSIL